MTALTSDLRSVLEKAIVAAREAAEAACGQALSELGVEAERAGEHLSDDDRRLRVALRAEARQLGGFDRLVEESAYEQWHRMLFARFLAENDLLIHPEHRVAVSLADCEEIAHARGHSDPWVVASEFASGMLPGIFRSDDPVLQLKLAPEGEQALEEVIADLPRQIFTSDDGLGWVYQYWQAKKKKEVNASERKIGGSDIAPVTQLFTEHYMVRFLLENTFGAWWASKHPESPLLAEWEYLRVDEVGEPAAGVYEGWPERVADVTVMDPCCGSGHFLVTAFEMLRRSRMEEEGLSAAAAGDAVLRDNLFGLELDPRCSQIGTFALALQAWRTGGYRELPLPNVACSGISAAGRLEDWKRLAHGDERLESALERLHTLFAEAGDLGSLIDPLRETDGDLLSARFDEVAPLFERAVERELAIDPSAAAFGIAVAAAARAASLLGRHYTLVTTNPPFLGANRQADVMRRYAEDQFAAGRGDLATMFLLRSLRAAESGGTVALVTPSNWHFLKSYQPLRQSLLTAHRIRAVVALGAGAFRSIGGEVVNAALWIVDAGMPSVDSRFLGIDLSDVGGADGKSDAVRSRTRGDVLEQARQVRNPDSRVLLDSEDFSHPVELRFFPHKGLTTNDDPRFVRKFWESDIWRSGWDWYLEAPAKSVLWEGRHAVVLFEQGRGALRKLNASQARDRRMDLRGKKIWGKKGVAVAAVGEPTFTAYTGEKFGAGLTALVAIEDQDDALIPALWCLATSGNFARALRMLDKKIAVTSGTVGKVPFDEGLWRSVAAERFPNGLPRPFSSDPTQWLFDGGPAGSDWPLQVAVARLLGYRWPRQTGSEFPDCSALSPDELGRFADEDGVVCLSAVRGERPAVERLRELLVASFGERWSPAVEADLLAHTGSPGKSLEQWLRDDFFEQHCQLFHQRPFIWLVWDGRKDGFSALLNYHRLDRANLERVIYTYLGDWIRAQGDGAAAGIRGSDLRLAAAQELQGKLELILEGEAPYDIFVRWKQTEEQPLGWQPDLNDGVRINIRPFVTSGVLRKDPRINWNKDRGKDPESTPWYHLFKGDRVNDHHFTLDEKRRAREKTARRSA